MSTNADWDERIPDDVTCEARVRFTEDGEEQVHTKTFPVPEWIIETNDVEAFRAFGLERFTEFSFDVGEAIKAGIAAYQEVEPGTEPEIDATVTGLEQYLPDTIEDLS